MARELPLASVTSSKARRQRKKAERSEGLPGPKAARLTTSGERAFASSSRVRWLLVLISTGYLLTVWLDGIGSPLPAKLVPRPWLYFAEVAALFKNAGMMSISYRAEGWSCSDARWVEVDVRPWFRIDAETKESRFHRTLQFYRKNRTVMRALEDYVVRKNNASSSLPRIGGLRFLSLRVPYPKLGAHVEPIERKPLSAYPDEMRHTWYVTPTSNRRERCGIHAAEAVPPPDGDERPTPRRDDSTKDPEP